MCLGKDAMTRDVSASLPPGSALLSGIPQHLLDDDMLADRLRRMGFAPSPRYDVAYAGVPASEWQFSFPDCPMRIVTIDPTEALAQTLSARYPGSEGRDFSPPEGRVLLLCWHEAALRMPDGDLTFILTALAMLSTILHPRLIQWRPARLWSPAPEMTLAIEKYLNGGPMPVLHIVGFSRTGKGASARIATRGLRTFTGQELSANAGHLGPAETVRRIARLAIDMIDYGPVVRSETIDGLMPGERIALSPSAGDEANGVVDIAIGAG
jgi:hypothetical protein